MVKHTCLLLVGTPSTILDCPGAEHLGPVSAAVPACTFCGHIATAARCLLYVNILKPAETDWCWSARQNNTITMVSRVWLLLILTLHPTKKRSGGTPRAGTHLDPVGAAVGTCLPALLSLRDRFSSPNATVLQPVFSASCWSTSQQ